MLSRGRVQAQKGAKAAACLRPGGRIVISHAQGAAFVREENAGNPAVARACLPEPEQLAALADEFNLDVLPAEQCLPGAEPSHTLQGEDFYLVALEKK